MTAWMQWISNNWPALCAGQKLCVPQHWLDHPQFVGFRRVQGWPKDQTCDWALAMDDRSRIHVQCYALIDGTPMYCVHRDRWDPAHGLGNLLMHVMLETPAGPVLGVGLGVAAIFIAANGETR